MREKTKNDGFFQSEIIGLIPAGGKAARISPLPCSKELYPVGFYSLDKGRGSRPKVVCHYLLEKMQFAGICKIFVILRHGKWDIPAYWGDGKMVNIHLAYLMMGIPYGVPYTLDQAYPFVQNARVAFGFPDIIFHTIDAFVQLLVRQERTNADIVLGLFPTDQPQKKDMVEVDDNGRIHRIDIKPSQTHLRNTWGIAVWTPVFTHFMHEYLAEIQEENEQQELTVGHVIQAALLNNLFVEGVLFPHDSCLDIGTPDDLVEAVRKMS